MKRLFLLLTFILSLLLLFQVSEPTSTTSPTIHVVIAADGRGGLGANLVADCRNMERLFKENVPKSHLNLVVMEMDEITPDNILETVKQVKVAEGDTLVFYYSGHAANDADSGGHYFQLKDDQGNSVELQRQTLLAALGQKKARLTVILTDCCNTIVQKTPATIKTTPQGVEPPDTITPVFKALFVKPK